MEMPTLKPLSFPRGMGYFKTLFFYTPKWEVVTNFWIILPDYQVICIPAGFIFDGASIPKIFRGLLSPVGVLLVAAMVHDYAYQHHYIMSWKYGSPIKKKYMSKAEADSLFLEIADYTNGLPWLNRIAYLAVRQHGIGAWSKLIITEGV
jgi:hypothetical protein